MCATNSGLAPSILPTVTDTVLEYVSIYQVFIDFYDVAGRWLCNPH